MTAQQKRFVTYYCHSLNGAKAAIQAGYSESRARITASELLAKEDVKAAVSEIMEQQALPTAEAIRRLTDMARASLEPFVRYEDEVQYNELSGTPLMDNEGNIVTIKVAKLDLTLEGASDHLHLLKKIKSGQYGLELELHDSKDAIVKLLEIQGKLKQPGTGDTEITIFQLPDNGR